jgi:hypothetical protein
MGAPFLPDCTPLLKNIFRKMLATGGEGGEEVDVFLRKKKFQKYFPNLFGDNRRVKNTFSELFGPQFFTVFLNI